MSLQFNMSMPETFEPCFFRTPHGSFNSEESGFDSTETKVKNALEGKLKKNFWFDSDPTLIPDFDYAPLVAKLIDHAGDSVVRKSQTAYRWIIAENGCFLMTDVFLGEGSYGKVYRGFTHNGMPCAIKQGKISEAEVAFLKELSHSEFEKSSIIQILAADIIDEVLVMELANTSLDKALPSLSYKNRLIVMRGILYGLTEASRRKIAHADLKPENVFLIKRDDYHAAKIGDFGLSAKNPQDYRGGTPKYHPPEYYAHKLGFSIKSKDLCKVDIWAAMLIFAAVGANMLSPDFTKELNSLWLQIQAIHKKNRSKSEFYKNMDRHFTDQSMIKQNLLSDLTPKTPLDTLLQAMSAFDPQNRLSAEEALNLFDGLFTPKPKTSNDLYLQWEGEFDDQISDPSESYEAIIPPDTKRRKIQADEDAPFESGSDSSLFSSIDLKTPSLHAEAKFSSGFELHEVTENF